MRHILTIIAAALAISAAPAKAAEITLHPYQRNSILISGRIEANDYAAFFDLLDTFPQVKTVFLNSGGGHLRPATTIARTIERESLKPLSRITRSVPALAQ